MKELNYAEDSCELVLPYINVIITNHLPTKGSTDKKISVALPF